jgi:hypothetical protein
LRFFQSRRNQSKYNQAISYERIFNNLFKIHRSLNLKNGKQSKGKFTQVKDLYFPKGCGSLEFELVKKSDIFQQISPLARSFRSRATDIDSELELIPSAQNVNEQFALPPRNFNNNNQNQNRNDNTNRDSGSYTRRSGNKNDGFYYPDFTGRYIHDNRGQYIHDNRGLYVHIPGPDGPPALPYDHITGPEGGEGGFGGDGDGG